VSLDGQYMASGSDEGVVKLWEVGALAHGCTAFVYRTRSLGVHDGRPSPEATRGRRPNGDG
jgi:hypothetical protein